MNPHCIQFWLQPPLYSVLGLQPPLYPLLLRLGCCWCQPHRKPREKHVFLFLSWLFLVPATQETWGKACVPVFLSWLFLVPQPHEPLGKSMCSCFCLGCSWCQPHRKPGEKHVFLFFVLAVLGASHTNPWGKACFPVFFLAVLSASHTKSVGKACFPVFCLGCSWCQPASQETWGVGAGKNRQKWIQWGVKPKLDTVGGQVPKTGSNGK